MAKKYADGRIRRRTVGKAGIGVAVTSRAHLASTTLLTLRGYNESRIDIARARRRAPSLMSGVPYIIEISAKLNHVSPKSSEA